MTKGETNRLVRGGMDTARRHRAAIRGSFREGYVTIVEGESVELTNASPGEIATNGRQGRRYDTEGIRYSFTGLR
jgi:hypothetical protein